MKGEKNKDRGTNSRAKGKICGQKFKFQGQGVIVILMKNIEENSTLYS